MNKVNATRSSFVDFVLPKLFPHISIVLELLRDGKWKVTQYECLRKGNSGGSCCDMKYLSARMPSIPRIAKIRTTY